MTSDVIPSDITEINEQIEELLTITPPTSERGRLFHLIKAALDHSAGSSGAGQPPLYLGEFTALTATSTSAEVAVNGGLASVSGDSQMLRVSYMDGRGVNTGEAINALAQANQSWRIGLVNITSGFSASYVGTLTGTDVGDGGFNTFSFGEAVAGAFIIPGTQIRAFAIPESGGGSGGAPLSVWQGSQSAPFTLASAATRPSSIPNGTITFVGDSGGDLFSMTEVVVSSRTTDGDTLDYITALIGNATPIASVWGHLLFHGTPTGSNADYYFDFKITNAQTVSGGVVFTVEPDPNGDVWADTVTDLNGYWEYVFTPQDLNNLARFNEFGDFVAQGNLQSLTTGTGSTGTTSVRVNNAAMGSITTFTAGYDSNAYAKRAKMTSIAVGDTVALVYYESNDETISVQYYNVTAVSTANANRVEFTVTSLYGDNKTLRSGRQINLLKV